MLFNSLSFIIFFAVVLFLHHRPFSWRVRKFNLLAASYFFYACWSPPFVLLLLLSTLIDWWAAARINRHRNNPVLKRAFLALSLAVNLGFLFFFKYGEFFLVNFTALLKTAGVAYQPPGANIILPVGISFYTFQTISYTLDVYHGKERPWKSLLDFMLYVSFFPQLVAGPIVRAGQFLPQCENPPGPARSQIGWGTALMTLGLFEKIFIADFLMAPIADRIFDPAAFPSAPEAWAGAAAFSIQIFCDFAGYSTCAIGAALCLGFALPDNFRYPYAAAGFSDFWNRWHMTLSTWLRDYLYIPLGGNRKGALLQARNLMITMLLGGLWHGASWTFVVWGGLHGLFLYIEHGIKKAARARGLGRPAPLTFAALVLLTYVLACAAWVFFRAADLTQAIRLLAVMTAGAEGRGDSRSAFLWF